METKSMSETETNMTKSEIKELAELNAEAEATIEATKQVAGVRLKLALRGAKAATFAVSIMTLLFKMDPRSSLGKATGRALTAFEAFQNELKKEIDAASESAAKPSDNTGDEPGVIADGQ